MAWLAQDDQAMRGQGYQARTRAAAPVGSEYTVDWKRNVTYWIEIKN